MFLLNMLLVTAALILCDIVGCRAADVDRQPEIVTLDSAPLSNPNPIKLRGALRRPDGSDPFGAVVVLHSCNGNWLRIDDRWGKAVAAWGYVALSVDSFGPRGIKNTCAGLWPADMVLDAYRALSFLVQQPYVDRSRVAVLGFSRGGELALWSVERGSIENRFEDKFRAAVAFYPRCAMFSRPMIVPALILIGENDDWTPAQACRDMVAGRSGPGIARKADDRMDVRLVVYPDTYHSFDVLNLQPGKRLFGHWLEYNKSATEQATTEVRQFLDKLIGRQ